MRAGVFFNLATNEWQMPRSGTMYKIVRFFFNDNRRRTVKTGLTLEEAQAHCRDPETSSKTAKSYAARKRTKQYGPWFDGYEECKR